MTLPPTAQSLVDKLIQELRLEQVRPIGLDIDLDDAGVVQRIEPRLRFSVKKRLESRASSA